MNNNEREIKIVLIQGSLGKNSRTVLIINEIARSLSEKQILHDTIDLASIKLEFCDGRPLEEYNDDLKQAYQLLKDADGYIIGMPVYQYSVSGPLKNFLDIVSGAMKEKPFGVACISGGIRSYLASADLMKILSFEVSAIPIQPTIHAYEDDFSKDTIVNKKIYEKIEKLIENLVKISRINK